MKYSCCLPLSLSPLAAITKYHTLLVHKQGILCLQLWSLGRLRSNANSAGAGKVLLVHLVLKGARLLAGVTLVRAWSHSAAPPQHSLTTFHRLPLQNHHLGDQASKYEFGRNTTIQTIAALNRVLCPLPKKLHL